MTNNPNDYVGSIMMARPMRHPLGECMYGKCNKVSTPHVGCPELEECNGIGDGNGDGNDGRAPVKERKNY